MSNKKLFLVNIVILFLAIASFFINKKAIGNNDFKTNNYQSRLIGADCETARAFAMKMIQIKIQEDEDYIILVNHTHKIWIGACAINLILIASQFRRRSTNKSES
jgi:hypothetical protein